MCLFGVTHTHTRIRISDTLATRQTNTNTWPRCSLFLIFGRGQRTIKPNFSMILSKLTWTVQRQVKISDVFVCVCCLCWCMHSSAHIQTTYCCVFLYSFVLCAVSFVFIQQYIWNVLLVRCFSASCYIWLRYCSYKIFIV